MEQAWLAKSEKWNPCAFSCSEDSKILLNRLRNGCEEVFDASSGEQKSMHKPPYEFKSGGYPQRELIMGRGLQTLVADRDGMLKVWDATNGNLVQTLKEEIVHVSCCSFSSCGTCVVVGAAGDYVGDDGWPAHVKLYDINTGELKQSWWHNHWDESDIWGVSCCDFAPCCTKFVFGLHRFGIDDLEKEGLTLDDVECTLQIHNVSGTCVELDIKVCILSCRFSPNGEFVLASTDTAVIMLWKAATWELTRVLTGHACHEGMVPAFLYARFSV
jgi:WD40 repeat protein